MIVAYSGRTGRTPGAGRTTLCETIEASSGNVFADLGLPNPEERLAKAELARQIRRVIAERELSEVEAADMLGIERTEITHLVRGRLSAFPMEHLLRFLTVLGHDVRIAVVPHADASAHGEITGTG